MTNSTIESDIIGVTICDECQSRLRLKKKHESLLGKTVRCPKCHSRFTCTLADPSLLEIAALQNEEEEEKEKKRSRRSKSEIREEAINSVQSSLRALHARLSEIAEAEKSSEEQIRIWCIDALRDALGYTDTSIDTETKVLGKRVDIVLKDNDKVFLVIECKNIRSQLKNSVRDQAINYATSLSADWAVITNGQIWKLYRVLPQKGKDPIVIKIFDVALLDEDGVSDRDAEMLYLLTSKAIFSGDLEKTYHQIAATSENQILKSIQSERVIKALRLQLINSYKEDTGQSVNITDDYVAAAIEDILEPLDF